MDLELRRYFEYAFSIHYRIDFKIFRFNHFLHMHQFFNLPNKLIKDETINMGSLTAGE
jgi:hypothetical protein